MADHERGLLTLMCSSCRRRSPMLIKGQYRWRCDHHRVTVYESAGGRSLVFDKPTPGSAKRPHTIDNAGPGPFFTRVVGTEEDHHRDT